MKHARTNQMCLYHFNADEDYYSTDCGDDFFLMDGTLADNHFYYCPRCGRLIELEETRKEEDDDTE